MKILCVVTTLLLILLTVSSRIVPDDSDYDDESSSSPGEEEDEATEEDEEEEQEESIEISSKRPPVESLKDWVPPTILYHNETSKYYEILTQGPCTSNLKFLPASEKPDEKYGDCSCHQYTARGAETYVPLVYHYPTEKCYYLYRQGYCKKKTQWLVFTGRGKVECTDNPCFTSGLDPEKVVWFNKECVELGDDCYLNNGNGTVVAFKNFDVVPTCTNLPDLTNVTDAHGMNNYYGQNSGCGIGKRKILNGGCLTVDVVG